MKQRNEQKVYKLQKAVYGLKQALRAWFNRIEGYFVNRGFKRSDGEQTLFVKRGKENRILIVSINVDDLLFIGNDGNMMHEFKNSMKEEFDMTDLGEMRFFLGIEVVQRMDGIFICQRKYAAEIREHFGMKDSNSAANPWFQDRNCTRIQWESR